jgi:hypothetical protein
MYISIPVWVFVLIAVVACAVLGVKLFGGIAK